MNSITIYHSEHHNNTKKIAEVIAKNLDSEIKEAKDIGPNQLNNYQLIGLGSGVYHGNLHEDLYRIVRKLPNQNGKKVFIFSTTGSKTYSAKAHNYFKRELKNKGLKVIGEFSCLGFDTALSPEGINKGRPNSQDLEDAKKFALNLKNK
ncbi:MAG: flavodoxin domain-containing protein [Candidatus Humimicrobiaceae bacterium]